MEGVEAASGVDASDGLSVVLELAELPSAFATLLSVPER